MLTPLAASLSPLGRAGRVPSSLLQGLVSFWKLDELSGQRADSVGGNHLTDNNTVTSATGKVGNAASFSAADDEFLSITDAAQVGLDFTGSFTLSAWVFPATVAAFNGIVGKNAGSAGAGGYILVLGDAANDFFRFQIATGTNVRAAPNLSVTGSAAGAWHHVIGWYDAGDGSVNCQRNNGTPVSATPAGGAPIGNASPFTIGRWTAASNDFDGLIDAVGVWSRVLTADERAALYNAGAGIQYPF